MEYDDALTIAGTTHPLSKHQLDLLKQIVTGTVRVASMQNDEQLIRDLGEILVMFA